MRLEIPDKVVTAVMLIDAYQQNRVGETDPEKFAANLETCERLTKLVGDTVATIILREVRKKQGLPIFVPRK